MAERTSPADLYLNLLKRVLTRSGFDPLSVPVKPAGRLARRSITGVAQRLFATRRMELHRHVDWDLELRAIGRDWPPTAETMIGLKRLDNLEECIGAVLADRIPGDLIETGVWRGGATIFMRAVLRAHGDPDRVVWVADSFQGLPSPDAERYPADRGDRLFTFSELAVSVDEVKANFARYGLLDDRVKFLAGWFRDTLPSAPIDQLAVLRLDGDMYESTIDALRALYPKVSAGGYVIVDDYSDIDACRAAVDDYRAEHGIVEPIHKIDWTGVYWRRATDGGSRLLPGVRTA